MELSEKNINNKPYLIFACRNCNQLIYSKLSQKTKKCPKCGKIHVINKNKEKGKIIDGISKTFEYVKEKQNQFAIKSSNGKLEFQTLNDYSPRRKSILNNENRPRLKLEQVLNEEYSNKFTLLLQKLSNSYEEFPFYLIELMADDFNIPISELRILINSFKHKGLLIHLKNNYFKINL